MNDYCIDSIELKRCLETPENIYKSIIPCDKCNKLPIPSYKSFRNQDSIYCRSCYLLENYKLEDVIKPGSYERNVLEQVIISCKNASCDRVFKVNRLMQMIEHEKKCGIITTEKTTKECKRCNIVYRKEKIHD